MIASQWSKLDGREIFSLSVSTQHHGSVEEETARTIRAGLKAIEGEGLSTAHIVRSRLFTQDRDSRQRASDVRRATLIGDLRGASSSFWDGQRLPADARVSLDIVVLRPQLPGATKQVVDYDPPIAPPMYVTLDGLVFLSGVTDTTPGLAAQAPAIRASIRASLEAVGAHLRAARMMSVFLAREEDPRVALALIEEYFPEVRCPVTLTQVGGYSAPEKRLEIEITAALG